jgi:hypothetical protein
LAFAGGCLVVLCLVEGLASLVMVGSHVARNLQQPLAERAHTDYDAELGWVNRANVALPNLYGPGASLHTNAQGFRGTRDVDRAAPPGARRIICSGDSFALGYGVADDETWCQQLAELAPGIESVNMGQGGYGIDQAYLWFLRDGAPLEHHVHLFSFIGEDFARMGATRFYGYGKPRLRLEGERLVADNVPVPRVAYWVPRLAQNAAQVGELRSVQLGRGLLRRVAGVSNAPDRISDAEIGRLAARVFAELERLHRAAGRQLVLVYLPVREELHDGSSESLRGFVAREAQRLGVPSLDATVALRELAGDDVASFYIAPGELDFPSAAGHFTARGNRWVATWLLGELRARGVLPR